MTEDAVVPPFECIFCKSKENFNSVEHIIPESMGNNLLVLGKGWVCDSCNNSFSGIENRVLSDSVISMQKVLLGKRNKKGKPVKSNFLGVTLHSVPDQERKIYVEAESAEKLFKSGINVNGRNQIRIPVHGDRCEDIAKMLLKIAVEFSAVGKNSGEDDFMFDTEPAIKHLLGKDKALWPYFMPQDFQDVSGHVKSAFLDFPEIHQEVLGCGFDVFFHRYLEETIMFFKYGFFSAGICVTTRDTNWKNLLKDWNSTYIGCPKEFAGEYWEKASRS